MKVCVLPEARSVADAEPEHREVLNRFIATVSGITTMGELVALPQVHRVVHPMFKWKMGRRDSRIIFRVSSSPGSAVLHILVHACVFHGREYDSLGATARFSPERLASAENTPVVAEFLRTLDDGASVANRVPRDYIGMRRMPAMLEEPDDCIIVEESEGWVEKFLVRASSVDGTVDRAAVDLVAGPVVDAVLSGRDEIIQSGEDTLLVETTWDGARVSLGNEADPRVRRRVFVPRGNGARDHLLHAETASGGQVDPFMLWHPRQEAMLRKFSSDPWSLPAFVDGPGGSGKTAILMWLVRGVLQHQDSYSDGTTVRFVTVNPGLARKFSEGLRNHLVLIDGLSSRDASEVASTVCRTVDGYLLEFLPDERRRPYLVRDSKIDWRRFREWYDGLHPSVRPQISPHEAWCALRALIRGDMIGRDDPRFELSRRDFDHHLMTWFSGLVPERRQSLDEYHVRSALDVYPSYLEWKSENNLWDDADLVGDAIEAFVAGATAGGADLLVVDEAQDLTPDTVRFLVRSGGFSRYRLDVEYADSSRPVPLPIVFAADDLQTINPSGFEWGLFRAVFYEETAMILNRPNGVKVVPGGLDVNFRMRQNVHKVAHGLRRWMRPTISVEPPEHVRDGGYSGPCRSDAPDVIGLLTTVERVIVPLDPDAYGKDSEVRRFLDACGVDWDRRVSPVTSTKGDEFGTVALVGFGSYLREAKPGQETRYARQLTYVGASRARDVAVWIEPIDDDRRWFWEDPEERAPAGFLPAAEEFRPEFLDPFRMSSDQTVRQELIRLVSIMRATDEDNKTRAARAIAAGANIRLTNRPEYAATAESADLLADYFRGVTETFRVTSLVPELRRVGMEMAAEDGNWHAFDGDHTEAVGPDLVAGWAVHRILEGDLPGFFAATEVFSRTGVPSVDTLVPVIGLGLVEAAPQVFEALRAVADGENVTVLESMSPEAVNGATVLLSDRMFAVKASFFREWTYRRTLPALERLRELTIMGDPETSEMLNKQIVATLAGASWVSPARVRPADLSAGPDEAALLVVLEDACVQLCSERDVLDRFIADVRRGSAKYSEAQTNRFVRVAFATMAASLSEHPEPKGR